MHIDSLLRALEACDHDAVRLFAADRGFRKIADAFELMDGNEQRATFERLCSFQKQFGKEVTLKRARRLKKGLPEDDDEMSIALTAGLLVTDCGYIAEHLKKVDDRIWAKQLSATLIKTPLSLEDELTCGSLDELNAQAEDSFSLPIGTLHVTVLEEKRSLLGKVTIRARVTVPDDVVIAMAESLERADSAGVAEIREQATSDNRSQGISCHNCGLPIYVAGSPMIMLYIYRGQHFPVPENAAFFSVYDNGDGQAQFHYVGTHIVPKMTWFSYMIAAPNLGGNLAQRVMFKRINSIAQHLQTPYLDNRGTLQWRTPDPTNPGVQPNEGSGTFFLYSQAQKSVIPVTGPCIFGDGAVFSSGEWGLDADPIGGEDVELDGSYDLSSTDGYVSNAGSFPTNPLYTKWVSDNDFYNEKQITIATPSGGP